MASIAPNNQAYSTSISAQYVILCVLFSCISLNMHVLKVFYEQNKMNE